MLRLGATGCALLLAVLLAAAPGAQASASPACNDGERRTALAEDQRLVLELLRPAPAIDLATLRNEIDLSALAALGYGFICMQNVAAARRTPLVAGSGRH